MKSFLRKMARLMSTWPLIGRFVQIGICIIRLPQLRAIVTDTQSRLDAIENGTIPAVLATASKVDTIENQLPAVLAAISKIDTLESQTIPATLTAISKIDTLENKTIPALLATISEINSRQFDKNQAIDNLIKSVPLALRNLSKDLRTQDATAHVADLKNRIESISQSANYLLGRVEFVRRELMYELRYGARDITSSSTSETEPKIVSKVKLEEAKRTGLRLNLGCGHIPLTGYLNVDRRALSGVDIVAEVDNLPFAAGELDEIYSAHLLEHFPEEQLKRELLPYWRKLLKNSGIFKAVVPDAETMIREYSKGTYEYRTLREVTFGSQDYDGDFHFNMFTPSALRDLLTHAGFSDVQIIEVGRRNGDCYEFEISGRRPPENR